MTTHTIANLKSPGTDCRVFFKRADETIYAVIGETQMRSLKRSRQLDKYLREQRESGIVIQIAGG